MEQKEKHRLEALEDWRRIEWIIRVSGRSINSFALHIGLPRGENLYQIKRGNNRISRDLAERIHCHYPMVSKQWILLGTEPKHEPAFMLGLRNKTAPIG